MRWFGQTVHLTTQLSLTECRERLEQAIEIERPSLFALGGDAGTKPAIGTIHQDRLMVVKRIPYVNPFASTFTGRLSVAKEGTTLRGEMEMDSMSLGFVVFFILVLLAASGLVFAVGLRWMAEPTGNNPWWGLLSILGGLMFIVTLFGLMRWQAVRDEEALVAYLKRVLDAGD